MAHLLAVSPYLLIERRWKVSNRENYKIVERTETLLQSKTIDEALEFSKAELAGFENMWSCYSSDCLGHAINFNREQILYLEELKARREVKP